MNNKYNSGVKIDMLRNMYAATEANKVIFDYLAERQRNYSETRPETLALRLYERDITTTRAEMISFFRRLEDAGCGKYIEGRSPRDTARARSNRSPSSLLVSG